jgi:hypothetical protein
MQALSRAAKFAALRAPIQAELCRCMSVEGLKGFKESEKVMENLYFNKEEEKLLGKILQKVKTQTEVADKHSAAGSKAADLSALKEIVAKYNVSHADQEKLLAWKNTHF